MKVDRGIHRRNGAVLVVVLACAAVTSFLLAADLRAAFARGRFAEFSRQRRQCEWLAEAGIERALVALSRNPTFTGEVWKLSRDEIDGQNDAEIRIAVRGAERRSIEVLARFPAGIHGATAVRRAAWPNLK